MDAIALVLRLTAIGLTLFGISIWVKTVHKKWRKYGFFDRLYLILLLCVFSAVLIIGLKTL